MSRESNSVCVRCRRAGEKLFLKGERCLTPKCGFTRRSYAPGKRGTKGFTRKTEYGIQLNEKQKAKSIYVLLERPFRNYYKTASKSLNTGLTFLTLLELRLDNVIKRANFAGSTRAARQLVVHEHALVNGKKVKSPNFHLKIGDIISFDPIFKLLEDIRISEVPTWLKVDPSKKTIQVTQIPKREDMNQEINEEMIIELYSR